MVLAGDSYEMKILCVTEQNYLSLFFFSPLFPPPPSLFPFSL